MEQRGFDYSEVQIRESLSKKGVDKADIDRLWAGYMAYREREIANILGPASIPEHDRPAYIMNILDKVRRGIYVMEKMVSTYIRYDNYKKAIREAYRQSKSWDEVITTVVYRDVDESAEAFIDYVEETYQTKVRDAEHLQELTGITQETIAGLEETIVSSKYSRYSRALENALHAGAKYKDLLQIKPEEFGLPTAWNDSLATNQYESILWAIDNVFQIGEPNSIVRADLKTIAKEIEAPYSVLMDAHKKGNFIK
jgi:hypothetical protein